MPSIRNVLVFLLGAALVLVVTISADKVGRVISMGALTGSGLGDSGSSVGGLVLTGVGVETGGSVGIGP